MFMLNLGRMAVINSFSVVGVLSAQSRPRPAADRLKAFSSMRRHVTSNSSEVQPQQQQPQPQQQPQQQQQQHQQQQQQQQQQQLMSPINRLRFGEGNNYGQQRPIAMSRSTNDVPTIMDNIQEHFSDSSGNDNNGNIHPPF